jgi:hypothetical protein
VAVVGSSTGRVLRPRVRSPILFVSQRHSYKCMRIIRCGNGLLTHILISEGTGIDIRARTSLAKYPPSTRAHLHVHAFDSTSENPNPKPHSHTTECEWAERDQQRGTFLIGNHADELSPWLPVLATAHYASGYLSIPCCAWSFYIRFDRSVPPFPPIVADDTTDADAEHPHGNVHRLVKPRRRHRCRWRRKTRRNEHIHFLQNLARLPEFILRMESRM